MGFTAFVKFALICFDGLAWPLFAVGYPLHASIQAIEANSYPDAKKIVTYWIIFSLISLFENAFIGLLQWLPFWPYMKLTIVCWLMIPGFDGAFYVYNHFVHPCLYMDVQTIVEWFKKLQESFLKDIFLAEADKYEKANGPESEALENAIASELKGREPSLLQKYIKTVQLSEEKEIAAVNASKGAEPCLLQKAIKPVLLSEEKEIAAVNAIPETERIASQTTEAKMFVAAACPELKGTCQNLPEIPSGKQVQKEWTCALCQVTTLSEKDLKMHFRGLRHRAAFKEIMMAKNQPSKAKVSPSAGNRNLQFRCIICNIGCTRPEDLNSHLGGKKHLTRIQELRGMGKGEPA